MRMEKFEYEFVRETGARVIIGKGGMKENTERACKEFGAIHCVFPTGNAVVAATEVEDYCHVIVIIPRKNVTANHSSGGGSFYNVIMIRTSF